MRQKNQKFRKKIEIFEKKSSKFSQFFSQHFTIRMHSFIFETFQLRPWTETKSMHEFWNFFQNFDFSNISFFLFHRAEKNSQGDPFLLFAKSSKNTGQFWGGTHNLWCQKWEFNRLRQIYLNSILFLMKFYIIILAGWKRILGKCGFHWWNSCASEQWRYCKSFPRKRIAFPLKKYSRAEHW